MDKLKALMGRKVMGIPVLYIVGLFVVILAVVAWRMKPAATPTETTADPAAEDLAAGDAGTVETPPVYVANPSASSTVIPDPNSVPTVDDNDKWARRSIEWLAAPPNNVPVDSATIALQKYLAGEQLSQAEGALRDKAIGHFGLPPDLPTSGGTEPPAPVTPTPTPKKYVAPGFHTVTGTSDDSYTDMARLWYGKTDNASVDLIQSYNVTKGHEGPFPIGSRFWIPKWTAPKYATASASMRTATQFIAKNPPLNSVTMLTELNDGMTFPVKVGTKVRVA